MYQSINGHIQTILGVFVPPKKYKSLNISKRILTLNDREQLSLHVTEGTTNVVVCLFHGLTGSVDSVYMKSTAAIAQSQGHTVVMCNHRGCGDGMYLAGKPYHSGSAEDISEVLKWVRQNYSGKKVLAIGFSLSANALLLLISDPRFKNLTMPDEAIAVNAPINLSRCAELIKMGFNRFYDQHFVQSLRKNILKRRKFGIIKNKFKIPEHCTLYDFDKHYTAPAAGFKNREEYYQNCSTDKKLQNIIIPTKILTSANDPFVDVSDYRRAKYSDQVEMNILASGGHMGYLQWQKNKLGSHRILDELLHDYIFNFHLN
jgi:predicted alpha/beta-fold hydrolase